jgi:superoxide dismutase, Cu-Zn family
MNPNPRTIATVLVLGLSGAAAAQDGTVSAALATADGSAIGEVNFQEMRAGMLVKVEVRDLPPGEHGIHVHQTGACTPDFAAAGEHLAPDGHEHGFAATDAPHSGDLPNVVVAADGTGIARFLNWRLTLEDLLDSDGSAVIVHAQADTYMDPTSAGDRLACGVVEQQS